MKPILFLAMWCFVLKGYSQKNQADFHDTSTKLKSIPCNPGIRDSTKIDTIDAANFGRIVDRLYGKLSEHKKLTLGEDRTLVLLMNTIAWSDYDKQRNVREKFPKLIQLEDIFNNRYKKYLYREYATCIGWGVSPYFIQLHVQYLGNPYACDRYYVIE